MCYNTFPCYFFCLSALIHQALGDVDAIMSRYYELADIAETFPPAFLGPRVIEANAGDKTYKLSVSGWETGNDLWKMLVADGFSKDPSRCRLLYDDKDVTEDGLVKSVDHLGIPHGGVVIIVDRFDFESTLRGGGGNQDPETPLKLP